MTNELAIRIITGDILGTNEQTHEAVTMAVKALSMRKRGKWIIEKDATGATYGRCSVCGIKQYGGHMNFCYECGADMREGGEDAAD